jgi:hypothetical protein
MQIKFTILGQIELPVMLKEDPDERQAVMLFSGD